MRLLKYLAVPALVLSIDFSASNYRLREAYDKEAENYLGQVRREVSSRTAAAMRDQIRDIFPLNPGRSIQAWSVIPPGMIEEEMSWFYDRHSKVIYDRDSWQSMGPEDWSRVHAPARVAAFANMVDFWVDHYDAGEKSGIPKRGMSNTLKSIMIGESYLDHNASNNGDYGVSQISRGTRATMRKWFTSGRKNGIDFSFGDDEYMNPYNSIRAGVWLFNEILENEAGGDLKLAVRAYNAGIGDARKKTRRSVEYQKGIERIIDKYFTDNNPGNSPLYVALKIHRRRSDN